MGSFKFVIEGELQIGILIKYNPDFKNLIIEIPFLTFIYSFDKEAKGISIFGFEKED